MLDVKVEVITPEMAEKYLERNISNRRLRQNTVLTYARDMKEGRWQLTHQGIAFDRSGELVDGQHRLKAIIEAGVPVPFMVTRNVESKVNLDNHVKRSLVDSTGFSSVKIAITRLILDRIGNTGIIRSSASEIQNYIENHMENLDFAEKTISSQKVGLRLASVKAALYVASFTEDLSRLMEFGEVLNTGRYTDYEEDSAALRLREWLLNSGATAGSRLFSNNRLTYFRTENAIKKFCERKRTLRLETPSDRIYALPA